MFSLDTKILFCDDMRVIREAVKRTFRDLRYKNLSDFDDAKDAWEAVKVADAAQQPFQLIISDWNMPLMKGIDFLKNVRSLPSMKDTPFLLLTAENEISQIVEAKAAGVSDYILKPFTVSKFQEKLMTTYLKMKKAQKSAAA